MIASIARRFNCALVALAVAFAGPTTSIAHAHQHEHESGITSHHFADRSVADDHDDGPRDYNGPQVAAQSAHAHPLLQCGVATGRHFSAALTVRPCVLHTPVLYTVGSEDLSHVNAPIPRVTGPPPNPRAPPAA